MSCLLVNTLSSLACSLVLPYSGSLSITVYFSLTTIAI